MIHTQCIEICSNHQNDFDCESLFFIQSASNTSSVPNNRAHDLYQVKMAIQAHTKRSQEYYNAPKSAHVQQQQQQVNDSKNNINIGE